MNILLVMLGGALGSVLRYTLSKTITWQQYPMATLCINTLGCLILGFIYAKYTHQQQQLFLLIGVGFCGGFTTFSTFSLEIVQMLQQQNYLNCFTYILLSILLGIAGILIGFNISKMI